MTLWLELLSCLQIVLCGSSLWFEGSDEDALKLQGIYYKFYMLVEDFMFDSTAEKIKYLFNDNMKTKHFVYSNIQHLIWHIPSISNKSNARETNYLDQIL